MELTAFLDCVHREEIPPVPPDGLTPGGHGFHRIFESKDWVTTTIDYCIARRKCTNLGMWAIVDMAWTKQLAKWIGKKRVLEVMAGRGWLAKALSSHGVNIVATDDGKKDYCDLAPVFDVQTYEASEAIKRLGKDKDVLLVSWPPYNENAICRAAKQWGETRPIIYVGEEGGCNAPDKFWEHFKEVEDVPDFPFVSWDGIHDKILIGHYRR